MKIMQINSVINYGSTGKLARDLYDFLESRGHECVIAFGRGTSTPGYKTIKIGSEIDQIIHLLRSRFIDRHGFGSKLATKKLIKKINEFKPDVIHLHNLHGYYLNIQILFEYISRNNIPVVWLLHDQWPISGHSAYFDLDTDGSIPSKLLNRKELSKYPSTIGFSSFQKNLKDKKNIFTSCNNMTIVTPSNWLSDVMKLSFLNKYQIKTIYNGIDTTLFQIDHSKTFLLKKEWNATNKLIILGVASVWDERKGLRDFIQLANVLPVEEYQIVLVGIDNSKITDLSDNIICIKRTNDINELKDIYNASDIFVNPTYFDNFPTVNLEALACGTPVITYETGGSSESLNLITGSVVKQGDINSLLVEIKKWGRKTTTVSKRCRARVLSKFTKEISNEQYVQIFKNYVSLKDNDNKEVKDKC